MVYGSQRLTCSNEMLVYRIVRRSVLTCTGRRSLRLAVAMDPTALVRESTARVVRSPAHVRIDQSAVERLTEKLVRVIVDGWTTTKDRVSGGLDALCFGEMKGRRLEQEAQGFVTWDSGDFHYFEDVEQDGPLTCQYVFVMDALNFCFWPTDK